jgi:hypothetical protein
MEVSSQLRRSPWDRMLGGSHSQSWTLVSASAGNRTPVVQWSAHRYTDRAIRLLTALYWQWSIQTPTRYEHTLLLRSVIFVTRVTVTSSTSVVTCTAIKRKHKCFSARRWSKPASDSGSGRGEWVWRVTHCSARLHDRLWAPGPEQVTQQWHNFVM